MAPAHHASASSSSIISSGFTTNYEVFLSFHGNDVRKNFADHLYHALTRIGIRTFRDSKDLHVGNDIGEELLTSIQESKISLPIFSENYPSSKWCLKELIQLSECRRTLDQIVMPIFYKVEPRDVRNQIGIYQNVFEKYQRDMVSDIEKWKETMKEIGGLKGWHVDEKTSEAEMVEEVVHTVYAKLKKRPLSEDGNLVGAQSRLREMLMLLDIESDNKKVIGIQGLGGIGKTTIARIVYNEVSNHFTGYSFIANVREAAQQYNGLVLLQKQLLWDTLKDEGQDITTVYAGTKVIQERLCCKKVLIVLDDVDHEDQVKYLVGDKEWFGMGSKIIITTRYKRILDFWESIGIYNPPPMNSEESLQLFSHHAFKRHLPPDDFLDMSTAMVETTRGLPLALQVIGSSLCLEENHSVWQEMLQKLRKVPHDDVLERLKISYYGLSQEEKQMFLDVACFFIGMYENIVCYIWKGCGFSAQQGLSFLRRKSLIMISEEGVLGMHDLLRDLGRYVVYQENADEPGKRTRIWFQEDVWNVLDQQEGTNSVTGLSVDFRSISENEGLSSEGFAGMARLRLLQIDYAKFSWNFKHTFSELRWLSWKGCPNQCIQTNLCPRKLVVLDLSDSDITADWMGWNYIKTAKNLKVLDLSYCCQLSRTPVLSANQNLEVLWFSGCRKLNKIDPSICLLTNLVILDMNKCYNIRSRPAQISKLTNLQQLNLCYKESAVVDVLVEISQLTALQSLSLRASDPSLKSISCLPPSLTSLKLSNCDSIQNISGLPSSLTSLRVEFCMSVVKVSSTLRGLTNLKTLWLCRCSRLEEIEGCDLKLDSLEDLTIQECFSLRKLPNLRDSKFLRTLTVRNNDFISDFEGLKGMDSLEELGMWNCKSLRKLPDLQDSKRLRKLNISGCPQILEIGRCFMTFESLQELTIVDCCHSMEKLPDHISNLHNLSTLYIEKLGKLTEIPGLDRLGSLQRLTIEGCHAVRRLPDGLPNKLTHLYITGCHAIRRLPDGLPKKLTHLRVRECKSLTEIPGISGLDNLEELVISCCESLETLLADLSNFKKLKHLRIEGNNKNLDEIKEFNISGCKFLEEFKISGFRYLQRLSDLSIFKKLRDLSIESCDNLNEILGVGELESLNYLCISGCESLQSLSDLSNLKKLWWLYIADCKILTEILGVGELESLRNLHISGCEYLESLPDLSNLKKLEVLGIVGCKNLVEIQDVGTLQSLLKLSIDSYNLTKIHGVDGLESLRSLKITGCDSLEILPDLSNFKRVCNLHIEGCKNLTEIQSVDTLKSLSHLKIIGCDSLEILPNLSNLTSLTNLTIEGCKNLT